MGKKITNIIACISEKTGLSEEVAEKVVTEFGKIIEEAARNKKTVPGFEYVTVIPEQLGERSKGAKKIRNAGKWYLSDVNSHQLSEETQVNYGLAVRQHIIDELRSGKKSDEILGNFIKISKIPNKVLSEKILEISPKTLYMYRHSDKNLPVRFSEQILKLGELYKKGIELFGTSEKFNKWIQSESYGLGNLKPIDIMNSVTGIDLIYEELIRIEFGATA